MFTLLYFASIYLIEKKIYSVIFMISYPLLLFIIHFQLNVKIKSAGTFISSA